MTARSLQLGSRESTDWITFKVDDQPSIGFSSPCAPSSDELAKWRVKWQASYRFGHNITYYLHDEGDFNLDDIKDCYLRSLGATSSNLDDFVFPIDAEHSTDWRLIQLLRDHDARTTSQKDATFHIVGAAINTAYVTYQAQTSGLLKETCVSDLQAIRDKISTALLSDEEFQRRPEHFVFIDTDWRVNRAFGQVAEIAANHQSIILAADSQIAENFAHMTRSFTIPYKTHYVLEDAAHEPPKAAALAFQALHSATIPGVDHRFDDVNTATMFKELLAARRRERPRPVYLDGGERDVPFMFAGNIVRRNNGASRGVLKELTSDIAGAVVADVDFKNYTASEFATLSRMTARTMLESLFCFVPEGDTPSSRRLFDALAAGCVPVIFAEINSIGPNLPFRRSIDWSQIAIFAGSLKCSETRSGAMKLWMESLLNETEETVMQIEQMRSRGREAYRILLSYESVSFVGAMMNEFEAPGLSNHLESNA